MLLALLDDSLSEVQSKFEFPIGYEQDCALPFRIDDCGIQCFCCCHSTDLNVQKEIALAFGVNF